MENSAVESSVNPEQQSVSQCSQQTNQQKIELIQRAIKAKWEDYYLMLNELSAGYQVSSCLKLLNAADSLLNQGKDLVESSAQERNILGGIKDSQVEKTAEFDHLLLGDMQGFASFKKVLKADAAGLAKLMRVLPTNGPVDGWHFMQFIDTYKQWFADNGFKQCHLFPATRLMAMKRPDQFVPLTEETLQLFIEAFEIKPFKKAEFQRYWDDIIEPLQKTDWFKTFQPLDPAQLPLHRVRFALLERLIATPVNEEELKTVSIAKPIVESIEQNEKNSYTSDSGTANSTTQFIKEERTVKVKKPIKQPKKMTITKRQSAKVNQNAATKLMSQYYFANKAKFAKVDMGKHRLEIIERLVNGESVEEVFESYL